jgi:septum formation protein
MAWQNMARLVLASQSPRRSALLSRIVGQFEVIASPVEESGSGITQYPSEPLEPISLPEGFSIPRQSDPRLWAWNKAMDVAGRMDRQASPDSVVLAADTVVVGAGKLFGKPSHPDEAVRTLQDLRGTHHYVVTGYVLLPVAETGPRPESATIRAVCTRVVMRDFTQAELEAYVATGEPMDKAGAYAVQGLGGALVERVVGCYTNVVGLPVCCVRLDLLKHNIKVLPYPSGGFCPLCPNGVQFTGTGREGAAPTPTPST